MSIPLNKFVLNDGAQGNDKETLKLIYFEYVKRSFKIANFKVSGGDEPIEKTTEFTMNDDDFVKIISKFNNSPKSGMSLIQSVDSFTSKDKKEVMETIGVDQVVVRREFYPTKNFCLY